MFDLQHHFFPYCFYASALNRGTSDAHSYIISHANCFSNSFDNGRSWCIPPYAFASGPLSLVVFNSCWVFVESIDMFQVCLLTLIIYNYKSDFTSLSVKF